LRIGVVILEFDRPLPTRTAAQNEKLARKIGMEWEGAMRKNLGTLLILLAGFIAAATPLPAHHGNASYDAEKSYIVKGTVTDYIWSNPHVFIKVDAKDESGNVTHWVVEGQNPVSMTQIGWTKNTFKPGDEVEIDAMPAKNGNPAAFLGSASPTAPRRRIVINGKQFQP
jgi:Family of unknown function (DUF6152)